MRDFVLHEDEAPGNKVLLAVSKSFGGCAQCQMIFPERLRAAPQAKRLSKRQRLSGASDDHHTDMNEPQHAPDGVFKDMHDPEERTWFHIPNFGRKFFDALRKYYMVTDSGQEIRVAIKRPDKESCCTWVGIVGNPRHYSTGGKRPRHSEDRSSIGSNFEPIAKFKVVPLNAIIPDAPADDASESAVPSASPSSSVIPSAMISRSASISEKNKIAIKFSVNL